MWWWIRARLRPVSFVEYFSGDSLRRPGGEDVAEVAGWRTAVIGGDPLDDSGGTATTAERGLSGRQLEDLVAAHGALVYRLAVAIVHDHSLAEDVVQDVIFKAWVSLPDTAGDVPVRWLRIVTRNTAIDLLRRRRFDDLTDRPPEPDSGPWQPDRMVEARHHLEAVWVSLGALDPDSRSMLALREAEHMSYDEIAATLDTTVSAVKAKLYRARHQLRLALSDWNE